MIRKSCTSGIVAQLALFTFKLCIIIIQGQMHPLKNFTRNYRKDNLYGQPDRKIPVFFYAFPIRGCDMILCLGSAGDNSTGLFGNITFRNVSHTHTPPPKRAMPKCRAQHLKRVFPKLIARRQDSQPPCSNHSRTPETCLTYGPIPQCHFKSF